MVVKIYYTEINFKNTNTCIISTKPITQTKKKNPTNLFVCEVHLFDDFFNFLVNIVKR